MFLVTKYNPFNLRSRDPCDGLLQSEFDDSKLKFSSSFFLTVLLVCSIEHVLFSSFELAIKSEVKESQS